jgi:hypothetical protein
MMTKKASTNILPIPPPPPAARENEVIPPPRKPSMDYSGDRRMTSLDLPKITPPVGYGNENMNRNNVAVDTGKNLSGNQVSALSRNFVDPDNNMTIIYVLSCFNNCCKR